MYSHGHHLHQEVFPPYTVIGPLKVDEDGHCVFLVLEAVMDSLCHSEKLVFCAAVGSEACLFMTQNAGTLKEPIQESIYHSFSKFAQA